MNELTDRNIESILEVRKSVDVKTRPWDSQHVDPSRKTWRERTNREVVKNLAWSRRKGDDLSELSDTTKKSKAKASHE